MNVSTELTTYREAVDACTFSVHCIDQAGHNASSKALHKHCGDCGAHCLVVDENEGDFVFEDGVVVDKPDVFCAVCVAK